MGMRPRLGRQIGVFSSGIRGLILYYVYIHLTAQH